MGKIQLIEINSELGAGTRGASLGIQAIKLASFNASSDYFKKYSSIKSPNRNERLFQENKHPHAIRIDGIYPVLSDLTNLIDQTLKASDFPIVLAGDHSTAAGTIAGLKKANPDKKLGVIWIDAHADLHSPYTTPSGNVHGMPLAMALAEDNQQMKQNDIEGSTLEYWNKIKNLAGFSPWIHYDDIVFIGLRQVEKEEKHLIDSHNIKTISVTEARLSGMKNAAEEALDHLYKCDLIYVSFDVDSMDSEYVSRGTGTPVPVGFSEDESQELLSSLLSSPKLCCFEITEVNPILDDKGNVMAETAFRLLESSTQKLESRLIED